MRVKNGTLGFIEKTCPICKKIFICNTTDWVYTRPPYSVTKSKLYFCTWSCVREYDNRHLLEIITKRRKRR